MDFKFLIEKQNEKYVSVTVSANGVECGWLAMTKDEYAKLCALILDGADEHLLTSVILETVPQKEAADA